MGDRVITNVSKDGNDNIVAVCNPDESWSPRRAVWVIRDIEEGKHVYRTASEHGNESRIYVVNDSDGKYLRTILDSNFDDNLDHLPACDKDP